MSLPKFVDEQEGNNFHTKAALEMLFSIPNFTKEVGSKSCNKAPRHMCIVNLIQELLRTTNRAPNRLSNLTESLMSYLLKAGVYENDEQVIDPMDMVTGILVNFHCLEVNSKCFEAEEIASMSCNNRCLLHKNFFLGVDETYACQCGNTYDNKWESNNTCQFYNISGIFEEFNDSDSKNLAVLPEFLLKKEEVEWNALNFKGKIHEKLFQRLDSASTDTCEDEQCRFKNSKISFRVTCEPKVYMMDLIWNNRETTHIESFLAGLGFKNYFNLSEIFKGARKSYKLNSVLFYGRDFYRLAQFKQGWCMEGLYENATWNEVLNETLLLNLHPVTVIYVEAIEQEEDFNLDSYELKKLEQLAAQCDMCLERGIGPVIPLDKSITGMFTMKQQQNAEQAKRKNDPSGRLYGKSENQKVEKLNENYLFEEERKKEQRIKELEDKRREEEITKKYEDEIRLREEEGIRRLESERKKIKDERQRIEDNKRKELELIRNKEEVRLKEEEKKNSEYLNMKDRTPSYSTKTFGYETKNPNGIDWVCECGKNNSQAFQVCVRCNKIKPGEVGWVCSNCKALNENLDSYICKSCNEESLENKNKIKSLMPKRNYAETEFKDKYENTKKEEMIEIWDCKCGASNMPDYEVCQICYKIKPGVKGWVCEGCKTLNSPHSFICATCGSTKDQSIVVNQEFWICEQCRSAIENNIKFCDKCMIYKNGEKMPRTNYYAGTNDYNYTNCRHCGFKTRTYSGKCLQCFKELEEPKKFVEKNQEVVGNKMADKDWTCPKCFQNKSKYLDYCIDCKVKKPSEEKKAPDVPVLKNDNWVCQKCGKVNNWITYCTKCYEAKPTPNRKIETSSNMPWKCRVCNIQNEYYLTKCTVCGRGKAYIEKKDDEDTVISPTEKKDKERHDEQVDGWKCMKCKIWNKNYKGSCSQCHLLKAKVAEIKTTQEISKKCTTCNSTIKYVICDCKRKVSVENKTCICTKSILDIKVCNDCSEKVNYRPNYRKYH